MRALVLEAPAAIRPEGLQPPSGSPEAVARLLYAHPERMPAAGPRPIPRAGGADASADEATAARG